MTDEQNRLVSATVEQEKRARAQASTSRSPSPVKTNGKPTKSKQAKKNKSFAGTSPKRKKPISGDEDDGDEGEEYNADVVTINVSDERGTDEDEFSELEQDTSVPRSRGKKQDSSTTVKKSSSSSKKSSKKPSSCTSTPAKSSSEAEQRLVRLKKLVSECGVRKPWKNLYEAAGISSTDYERQCTVVQGVLRELGMTGKGSMEQAHKIRAKREFADELAALQDNPVLGRTRRTRSSAGSVAKPTMVLSDDDEESDAEVQPTKRSRKVDSESEDEGPSRRVSFFEQGWRC